MLRRQQKQKYVHQWHLSGIKAVPNIPRILRWIMFIFHCLLSTVSDPVVSLTSKQDKLILLFLYFCSISLHCCFVSHAVYLVDPFFLHSAGESCKFDILHENELVDRKNKMLWLLSLCSCLSPWAKMPVTDTVFGYWVDSNRRLWALISWHFVTFLSGTPYVPHFVFWSVTRTFQWYPWKYRPKKNDGYITWTNICDQEVWLKK